MGQPARATEGLLWIAGAFCLLALVAVMFAVPVNFSAVDLGRHLKNGELFLSGSGPLATNFYSYTEPDFPAVNHHWLSGVVFYALWKIGGFAGLHAVYLATHVLSVWLLLRAARRVADYRVVLLVGAALLPLLVARYEIRPEGLSYLALAVLIHLLIAPPARARLLVAVAVLSVLWVNSHIFFFLGWVVTGAFMVQAWVDGSFRLSAFFERDSPQHTLLLVLLTQIVASLVSPFGIAGVIEPFTILREYGYTVLENQPIPFILQRLGGGVYWHFLGAGVVAALLIAWAALRGLWRDLVGPALLLGTFYALGFSAVRAMTLFALVALPFASQIASRLIDARSRALAACGLAALSLMAACLVPREMYFSVAEKPRQLGLMKDAEGAGKFLQDMKLGGPIFNNYDVGGYFIHYLFPHYRPFVDNRPEAYSVRFLREVYAPMLSDEAMWKKVDAQYRFNVIFFYRHDATEHAQPFLIRRIADPEWEAVFVDAFNLVLVRNTAQNARIIRDYALPKAIFQAVKN